jgi:hypothetical protein
MKLHGGQRERPHNKTQDIGFGGRAHGESDGRNKITVERFNASARDAALAPLPRRRRPHRGRRAGHVVLYLRRGADDPPSIRDQYGMNDVADAGEVDIVVVNFID